MLWSEILIKGAVVHERLVAEYGFPGTYQRVKLYMQEARPRIAEELGISPGELAGLHRRFEVVPGAQAQVDWTDEGQILAHVGIPKVYSASPAWYRRWPRVGWPPGVGGQPTRQEPQGLSLFLRLCVVSFMP